MGDQTTAVAHYTFELTQISLLEWSEHLFDITTVSIHTYERAPKVLTADPGHWRGVLRVDPSSRCAALSLPKESLAILPFHTAAELEMMDQERQAGRYEPYLTPPIVAELICGTQRYSLLTKFYPRSGRR